MPSREPNALERMFPAAESIGRVGLVSRPTPVEPMAGVARELGMGGLWVKRDDLSGEFYGGNKIRKLEYIFAEAMEAGCDEVLTMGAIGSHHVLATAIYARELGLAPAAQHWMQPITPHVLNNLRALSTTRPELRLVANVAEVPFRVFKSKLDAWLAGRPQTFFISGGGSSTRGVLGYVDAALELAEQISADEFPEPDRIFVSAGTTGTLAGLALGVKMAGLRSRVVGVRVVEAAVTNKANVLRLARAAASLMRGYGVRAPDLGRDDFDLLGGYLGAGYGAPTPEGACAIELAERGDGLHLDPTYTGKCFAALVGERGRMGLEHERVLFWNTLSSVDLSARISSSDVSRDLPSDYLAELVRRASKDGDFDVQDFTRGLRLHG